MNLSVLELDAGVGRRPPKSGDGARLLACLALSVLAHAAAATWWLADGAWPDRASRPLSSPELDQTMPEPVSPPIGADTDAPARMAWISHKDFRELVARQEASLNQPAVQDRVDPLERAPLPEKPTPPAPVTEASRPAAPAAAMQATQIPRELETFASASAAARGVGQKPRAIPTPPLTVTENARDESADAPAIDPAELHEAIASTIGEPGDRRAETRPERAESAPAPTDRPAAQTARQPQDQTNRAKPRHDGAESQPPSESKSDIASNAEPSQAQPASPKSRANPTAAARRDFESPLAALTADALDVRPGRVLTGRGVEIKTAVPDFSIVTRMTAAPRNPVAELTFSPTGRVIDARLTRSTGYSDVDGPLLTSLYNWRASGELLERIEEPFDITVNLILVE